MKSLNNWYSSSNKLKNDDKYDFIQLVGKWNSEIEVTISTINTITNPIVEHRPYGSDNYRLSIPKDNIILLQTKKLF